MAKKKITAGELAAAHVGQLVKVAVDGPTTITDYLVEVMHSRSGHVYTGLVCIRFENVRTVRPDGWFIVDALDPIAVYDNGLPPYSHEPVPF